jgi:predicted phosphodiesterase
MEIMTQRLAIITDIHGNYAALQAVLKELETLAVDHIYCLGDMIAIGHETNEVLETLASRNDTSMILGNHEDEVLRVIDGHSSQSSVGEKQHHEWIANTMRTEFVPLLKSLPLTLSPSIEGKHLLFTHYHMDEGNTYMQIDRHPTIEKLDKLYSQHQIDFVGFGHHHPVHFYESTHALYVNPGALGCSFRPEARFGLITINEKNLICELRAVAYDNQKFFRKYETLQVPDYEFILNVFHGNQHKRK